MIGVVIARLLGIQDTRTAGASPEGFLATTFPAAHVSMRPEYRSVATQRIRVPLDTGARVILGSLDESAESHTISISWVSKDHHQDGGSNDRDTVFRILPSLPPDPPPSFSHVGSTAKARPESRCDSSPELPDAPQTRIFRLPHFSSGTHGRPAVTNRVARCILAESSDEVSVYDTGKVTIDRMRLARSIAFLAGSQVLPFIRSNLGRISDIDNDQRLSVVLCDLADDESSSETPIWGCVRASDFLNPDSDFSGDIIFLDHKLAHRPELAAVLTHEFSHAAAFSLISEAHDSLPGPTWLNEAIAHTLESLAVSQSGNLANRLDLFLATPHQFALVIPEESGSMTGRGPERAAGMLFGRFVHDRGVPLSRLITASGSGTHRIEAALQADFSDVFRDWTISLLKQKERGEIPLAVCPLDASNEERVTLRGTAAVWMQADRGGTLEVSAPKSCRLQLTVIGNQPSTSPDRFSSSSR